jgi:hypothetical protein
MKTDSDTPVGTLSHRCRSEISGGTFGVTADWQNDSLCAFVSGHVTKKPGLKVEFDEERGRGENLSNPSARVAIWREG